MTEETYTLRAELDDAKAERDFLRGQLEDCRDRLAKAGAHLSTVEGELVKAQVEAEAATKKTARKVVEEVVDEALAAAAVAEDWFNGLTPDHFILLMKELQDRMDARIHAIDDFSPEMPF